MSTKCTALSALTLFTGCAFDDPQSRAGSHLNSQVWSDATNRFGHTPGQLMPALALLGAIPVGFATDSQVTYDYLTENRRLSDHSGDEMQLLMLEASAATSAIAWLSGDEGRFFETWLETNLLTVATTHALKVTVRRQRPVTPSRSSFPSGHTSFTVSMGALMARGFDDLTDEWWGSLGYLFYVPGAITALERVEQRQHFVSDVAAGALIGFTFGNIIWNAHYGAPGQDSIFSRATAGQFMPMVDEDSIGLAYVTRF